MSEPVTGGAILETPAPTTERPPQAVGQRGLLGSAIGSLVGAVPTLLVVAGAVAVGWWGHHSGWKLPKFSELSGRVKDKDDWCGEHNVPESVCVECDADLLPRPAFRDWCRQHGVPECTLCSPELAQLPSPPVVTAADLARAKRALDFADRPANNAICRSHHRRIQFATIRDADKAGVAVEPVWTAPAVEFVSTPGEIGYDRSRVAHLSTRSPGTVRTVLKHLGQEVKVGDVLALVDAAEVGKAKAELLQAFAGHQLRTEALASVKQSGGAVSGARLRETEAALVEAEIRLSAACQSLTNLGLPFDEADLKNLSADRLKARLYFLGIPADVAKQLDAKTATTNLLPVVTPLDGLIVSREIAVGEVVDVTRVLYEVVDTRSLWLTFDLKNEDARRVNIGHPVRFKPDNGREDLAGKIAWRSAQADPRTRTVKVRADIADPERKQVANTFGSGRVILREEADVVSVPNDAVHWEGCCHVVFVRDKDYLCGVREGVDVEEP